MRAFSSVEVTWLIGFSESTIRQLDPDKEGPSRDRLAYTLAQVNEIRQVLANRRKIGNERQLMPKRRPSDKFQVMQLPTYRGSSKITSSVHLTHYLALQGYRVLPIDLDPQASLSAMFGAQPEFDVGENETFYGPLRYDDYRRPWAM